MANGLLAIGASPAMVHAPGELDQAIAVVKIIGGAVSINIGTLDATWIESFKKAVLCCKENGVPWVLDPVAAGFTSLRTDTALELMRLHPPAVVRGNSSEIQALVKSGTGGKGVDSADPSEKAVAAAKELAETFKCVVCVSGAIDYVVDPNGSDVIECAHGVPMLQKITATGCLLSSLCAAFVVSRPEDVSVQEATAAACAFFGICAELADKDSSGPGTLRANLLDKMYTTTKETCTIAVKMVKSVTCSR
eukprot:CAMPEP_0178408870 /NCGR_PEP_ID=MMETSP0689_2-20121128/20166_1 /TAXON_ID=160604 /ORGANISM="Amphidinium massartii, Strain CS-259" /LENGTH=249 /DNA_ID=CAMNT_0020029987 /DNA_START=112 /DNA_END=861 /DNA_ORIENTATION=+